MVWFDGSQKVQNGLVFLTSIQDSLKISSRCQPIGEVVPGETQGF